jgi:GNAT superfamily N-acetyltransferase
MTFRAADVECVPVQNPEEIAAVVTLALQIWPEYYIPIIGAGQVEYMLRNVQSPEAIHDQIKQGHQYFLVKTKAEDSAQPRWIGYVAFALQLETARLFISKLYVLSQYRGRGLGRALIDWISSTARQHQINVMWLTVNKTNPAYRTYLHWGFVNKGSIVKDIGNGFVMDDYQMEKSV